ncbi:prokaryotic ubiquitin-like protein Pup [Bowdeniella nasicola]|uniref:Prokaryotic ubiquitin-like protein Pup n=1 Tax=Bowdeniella nasicola TaxID=208480 RepID=A0A1H4AXL8_9ACTO|nr:ubiquitin-like protein Pup [Bowdeniella nasicola]SEA40615.1 prokaryotic ubiquitin-like protein Pup [Bowdeniella nasicola]
MRREYLRPQSSAAETEEEELTVTPSAQTENVDDLLDEIDTVLEANAESFVQGFVQKGGQ